MATRLSRVLAVALATPVATSVLVAATTTTAFAAAQNFCAHEPVIDGTTRIRACIKGVEGDTASVMPWARMRFASPDPTKWESCTVIVALFIDGQKRTDRVMSCLAWAQVGTSARPEVETFGGWTTRVRGTMQYEGVARWFGVYDGQAVGSHVNSHSPQISFVPAPGGLHLGDTPLPGEEIVNDPPVPSELEEYVYQPGVPVEYDI